MKIWKRLRPEHIFLNMDLPDREQLFQFLSNTAQREGLVRDARSLHAGFKEREATMSTGIGNGLAIPHAAIQGLEDAVVLLIRLKTPIEFESLDGSSVDLVLALLMPAAQTQTHLRLLAGVSRLCRQKAFWGLARGAADSKELWQGIKAIEERMAFH